LRACALPHTGRRVWHIGRYVHETARVRRHMGERTPEWCGRTALPLLGHHQQWWGAHTIPTGHHEGVT
jgi:hypothetical protein